MNIDRGPSGRRQQLRQAAAWALAAGLAGRLGGAKAQASGGSPAFGTGPGFHDPRSAFKPLQELDGVVSWRLLSSVTARLERNRVVPQFPSAVQALNGQQVKLQGFMMPLEPVGLQRHFLLSSVPTTCSFCVPAGPEGLVEVRMATPLKYSVDAVIVQGKLAVLSEDKYGLFYRLEAAQPVSV
jgi:hypothetical protein